MYVSSSSKLFIIVFGGVSDVMCFRYSPGDIVIFFSDAFYHSILPWAPLLKQPEDIVTPGRVSWVLNTHTDVLQKFLADDYERWIYHGRGYCKGYQ